MTTANPTPSPKPLATHAIGSTGVVLTEIGLGTAQLGNLYENVDDATAARTVEVAIAAGIRYIDTAPYYGFGLSEQRVGLALRTVADAVVSTKVGRLLRPAVKSNLPTLRDGFCNARPFIPTYDYSYSGVMRSWEDSLTRTGLDHFDILLVHDIGRLTHGDANRAMVRNLFEGGGLKALHELRDSGVARAIGLGVNEVEACLEILADTDLDLILLAGRYTLLEQASVETLFPACRRSGTSIVLGGIYNSGILATGTGAIAPTYNYTRAPDDILSRVGKLESIARRHSVPLAAAALQFALAHPQVASVLAGMGSPETVMSTLSLRAVTIPMDFWEELRAQSLLHVDAPVPGEAVSR